jgi:hypothetical protein
MNILRANASERSMRSTAPLSVSFALLVLAACASPSTGTSSGGSSGTGADGPDAATGDTAQKLDLTLTGTGLKDAWFAEQRELELLAAVQDDTTNERVGWAAKTIKAPADTYAISFPAALESDHDYRVVLYSPYGFGYVLTRLVGVTENVTLTRDFGNGTSDDEDEAFEILQTPLELPSGTYEATLNAADTHASFVVGPTGRLSSWKASVGCDGGCGGSRISDTRGICRGLLVRGDDGRADFGTGGNDIWMDATVVADRGTLRVRGKVEHGGCCSAEIDAIARRSSGETHGCD